MQQKFSKLLSINICENFGKKFTKFREKIETRTVFTLCTPYSFSSHHSSHLEWKRKRAFSERLYISGIPSMYNFSGSKYVFFFSIMKKELEKGRRWKRVLIFHFQAKYVFERRFTARHLTIFGFFLTYYQSVRAKKREGEKGEKGDAI